MVLIVTVVAFSHTLPSVIHVRFHTGGNHRHFDGRGADEC